jgi:hypothetical protein
MLQNAPQKTGGAACSPQGRARQITARTSNGVHFERPVLPNGVESQEAWDVHLASLEEALQPVGAWEKLCVYRIALSAWKHFRLVRHELSLVAETISNPANEFKTEYDDDYVHAGDVAEVLARSEASLEGELSRMRDLVPRIQSLSTDGDNVIFTAVERRQILSAIIEQLSSRTGEGEDAEEDDSAELVDEEAVGDDAEPISVAVGNEDAVTVSAVQLREELGQIAAANGWAPGEAIDELVTRLEESIRTRQHRLRLARTHIGACLIPDERNVNRLALYERQLDAASRRYLNDRYRAQALRLGQPVAAPIAVDVNVVGESNNDLH